MHRSRRSALRATGVALAGGLAGCLGDVRSQLAGGGGSDEGLTLESLAVGGSPGSELVVNPAGEVTLVDFFATWCQPCKPQMEGLGTVRERYPDLAMRSITNETDRDAVRDFWREYDGTWPVLIDPQAEAQQAYQPPGVPTLYVYDADGEEVWRHTGLARTERIAEAVETAQS
jgi:thiol-disulfide isomerase/thioredoxin